MKSELYFPRSDPELAQAMLVLGSSAIAVAVSLYSLDHGMYFIFQNFFYLPIVLACLFYRMRGFLISVVLSSLYVVMIASFTPEIENVAGAAIQFGLFIFVAAITATLLARQKRTEEELAASRQTLDNIIRFLPDATFAQDLDGRIIAWNHAMEKLTGIRSEEVLGKEKNVPFDRILGVPSPLLIDLLLRREHGLSGEQQTYLKNTDGVLSREIEADDGRGRTAVYSAVAAPLHTPQGEIVGAIESIRDVTPLYEIRARLQQANASLTQVNTKLQLLGKMTQHDMLNTIQILTGYITMIKHVAPATQPLTEYVDEIDTLTRTLCDQVEFARDYQSIGIKKPVWQNLQEMVARALATVTSDGVTIATEVDPMEVYTDPLLERVIYNLATNAINHGKQTRRITISTEKKGSDLVIICEDDGVGIPEHLKEAIFKREHYANTGYGLLLAREILAITNLTIRETGTPGKGARFEILVPEGSYRPAGADAVPQE